MASQPCEKCGITVDPEIQAECPSCGREIKVVVQPRYDIPPPPSDGQSDDFESHQYRFPPPPPPGEETETKSGGFLPRLGVRVLIGLLIFGGFSAYRALSAADRDDSGIIVDEGDVAATELAIGDCLQDPGDDVFEEVTGVACTDEHDFEIFHLATVSGLSYPSDAQFDQAAEQHCLPAFSPYTGEVYEDSDLWIGYFIPEESAWSAGDRVMQCYLYIPDGKLSRSRAAG